MANITSKDVKKLVIRVSSGTTGTPHVVIREGTPSLEDSVYDAFPKPKQQLFFVGPLSNRLNQLRRRLYDKGSSAEQVLSIDGEDLDPALNRIVADFEPDYIWAAPISFFLRALEFVEPGSLKSVCWYSVGGELYTKTQATLLDKKLQCPRLVQYASAETGPMGFSCRHLPAGTYHPADGVSVRVENTLEDGIGSLVVSSMHVKDHKPGDSGKMLPGICACGRSEAFEVMGRTDFDFIRLCGAILHQEELDRVAGELDRYVEDYRVLAREKVVGETLCGTIELSIVPSKELLTKKNPEDFIAQEFARRLFVTPTQTLGMFIEKGLYLPLTVLLVRDFSQAPKNIKMRLLREPV